MSFVLLLAAAAPLAGAASPVPTIDYARMIDDAIDGSRILQAETMLAQWRSASEPGARPVEIATARLALTKGEVQEAETRFAAISSAGSDDCRVNEGLGIARLRLGRAGQSLTPLSRAVDSCPGRWRAWSALAVAYDQAQSWSLSAVAYERAFQLTDRPVQVLNNYGMSLVAQGKADKAVIIFDKAREMAPDDARIIANGDTAHVMAGRDISRRTADDADTWAKRLTNAGQVALRIGDATKARAYLSQAMTQSERFMPEAAAALATIGPEKP